MSLTNDNGTALSALTLSSPSELEAIGNEVLSRVTAPEATLTIVESKSMSAKFVKNDMHDMGARSRIGISLGVAYGKRLSKVRTDRIDREGLDALVQAAEAAAKQDHDAGGDEEDDTLSLLRPTPELGVPDNSLIYREPSIAAGVPMYQGDLARAAATQAETANLVGAGNIDAEATSKTIMNSLGLSANVRDTYGEYSITARTQSFRGSGWAWGGHEDFSTIAIQALTEKAMDVAQRSDEPVGVEPGRYTVILEPAAVAQLVMPIVDIPTGNMSMRSADQGQTVFSILKNNMPAGNKIGHQMADRRFQMSQDPMDPLLPYSAWPLQRPVVWFKDGVLQVLAYKQSYGREKGLHPPQVNGSARVTCTFTGAPASLDDMIASTYRGIWVHRLSSVALLDQRTLLLSGVTRDGTFLIERGKVTKAVKNFRFVESPFFVLNKIEGFGEPVRASRMLRVPRLLVRDFEFTSLSEAI